MARGVLWVGRHVQSAHLRPYDLDGHPLAPGFTFRDPECGGSSVEGLAVDADRGVWVADGRAACIRRFSIFGGALQRLEGVRDAGQDARGALSELADLSLMQDEGGESAPRLLVAQGGWRRHALQVLDESGAWLASLRCMGDPREAFQGLRAIAVGGRWIAAAEAGKGRVQVFRDGEFHLLCRPFTAPSPEASISAVSVLDDGRLVVALSGGESGSAVLFLDAAGRLLCRLAGAGRGHGCVVDPTGLALEPGREEAATRLAVLDRDGDRVQVFSLGGRCYGELTDLPGATARG